MHRALFAILAWAALATSGCQMLSASVTSISDSAVGIGTSISGSFTGLLNSSGIGGGSSFAAERYREDVRLATREFVDSGGSDEAFLREIGRIAERHGISDWEARPETLTGLGAGLRQAGVPRGQLDAILARLGRTGDAERALAAEGWQSASL
jgi:hypothetical protein